ncbi:bactericidal permeability-increasing protein-like [Sycon ciliatum]|uniref:bactericidal permeability-increasing protein-like n=1 Tax=Sycon ciliatum TaxID=27933 RepID=UPI0020ACD7E0|eukprot:scpid33463/ scgid10567/ Bactericidal permeability-increasing protein; CAP 57
MTSSHRTGGIAIMPSTYAACVVLLLALVSLSSAASPGFRTELTQKGLDYIRSVGLPILEQEIGQITIPDISGDTDDTSYSLSSIRVTSFNIPTSSVAIVPGTGVTVAGSGATMTLHGNWHYRMDWWPHVSDSGTCDVSISDVSMSFTLTVGADAKGHATISCDACSANIGHMGIDFHGGASFLYNLFSSEIAGSIKGSVAPQICSAGKSAINTQGNAALESLPIIVAIDDNTEIDYGLIAPPAYDNVNFLETVHKGEFYLTKQPTEAPYVPAALPAASQFDRMMYIWLTAYMADTAGYVYEQSGILHYTITPAMVPSSIPIKLNTESFKDIVPALYKAFPNMPINLAVNNTAPMTMNISETLITGLIPGTVQVLVQQPNGTEAEAFVLSALIHANATAWTHSNNSKVYVSAKAVYMFTELSLVSTNIGQFNVALLDVAVNALAGLGVIPFINSYTVPGIEIPIVDGVALVNPTLQLGQGYAVVATDFSYKPSYKFKN